MSESATLAEQIDAALAMPDSWDFVTTLATLAERVSRRVHGDPRATPPLVRMSLALDPFFLYVSTNGMQRWLEMDGVGAELSLIMSACKAIGATRALAYLRGAGAIFPSGRIPTQDDARIPYLMETASVDARFEALDAEFADALGEMGECLRAFVRTNRRDVDRAFVVPATVTPRPPTPPGQSLAEQSALLQSRIDAFRAREAAADAAIRAAAVARGLLPWTPRDTDPRTLAFAEAVNALGEPEWRELSRRVFASKRRIRTLELVPMDLERMLKADDLVDWPAYEAARQRDLALCLPAWDVVNTLPAHEEQDGIVVAVYGGAYAALRMASRLVVEHEWMMLSTKGMQAARACYALFDGFAPCPPVPKSWRAPTAAMKRSSAKRAR